MDFFVWQRTVVDEAGNVLPSASVSVTDVVSGALVQLYSDEGVTGIGNPITADANGFVQFYVKAGVYDIVATSGANTRTWSDEQIGRYETGYVERLGAIGSGSVVDDTAFTDTLAAHVKVMGQPGKIFVLSSGIAITSSDDWRIIDLQGSIVEPDDNDGRFTSSALTATATSTISSGATIGSRSVVVTSAASMAVGQWVKIIDSALLFPAFWAKITSIVSTTLEFDRTLPVTYSGTINISTYAALRGKLRIKNIVFDGTNVTSTPGNDGHALRLVGFERVELDNIELRNYDYSGGGFVIHLEDCVDVEVGKVRATDSSIGDQVNFINVNNARKVTFLDNELVGGGFGANANYCETAVFAFNTLHGRRTMEEDESITARSTRGLKTLSCGHACVIGNDVSDYESAIKIERIHTYLIDANKVRNCGQFTYDGSSAIGVTSVSSPGEPHGIVSHNIVQNCGAIGLAIDDGNSDSGDGNAIVDANHFINIGAHAIYSPNRNITVTNNRFKNWNTLSRGSAGNNDTGAVWYGGGVHATGNTFENSDTADACFIANLVGGQRYCFKDNDFQSGNPEFAGGLTLQATTPATATINSGATTVVVNHTMLKTPVRSEIKAQITTNPTNDPGFLYVSAVTSTQITFAVRNDPGSGGMNLHWYTETIQPFTA